MKVKKFDQHPLSKLFPPLNREDLKALREDIKANDLIEPIVLHEGMVLDGWNRYCCCEMLGINPQTYELPAGTDPATFVWSRNGMRRQMTASQRAAVIVKLHKVGWRGGGRYGAGTTEAGMAKQADVSERTIRQAKAAEKAGVGDKVLAGKVSAKSAAQKRGTNHKRTPETSYESMTSDSNPAPGAGLESVTDEGAVSVELAAMSSEQIAELAHGGTAEQQLQALESENRSLTEENEILRRDDTKAELSKYVRLFQVAERRAWDETSKTHRAQKLAQRYYDQLLAIARAFGSREREGAKIVTIAKNAAKQLRESEHAA